VSDARSTLYQDLFGLDGLLTEEEREVRKRVRAFSDAEVIPIMADCWERGEFPFQLVPKLAALSICGVSCVDMLRISLLKSLEALLRNSPHSLRAEVASQKARTRDPRRQLSVSSRSGL
jgi:hypothetical protein